MSRWTTKNKPAAAIHATKISWTLAHAFFASASVPGLAPSRPANRSCTSVPVVRGSRNRQEADRTTQPTNPHTIADRRRFDVRSCSRVRPAYAAARRATPGKSALKATHPKMPALNGPSGPSRFRATARIQMRFVASRMAEASHSRVAESPRDRSESPLYAKPFVPFPGLRTRRRLVKGFGPKVPGDDLRDPGRANLFVLPGAACLIAAARNAEEPEDDASPDVWLRSPRVSVEAAQAPPRPPAGGGPPRTSPRSSGTSFGPASPGSPARGRRGLRGPRPRPIGGRGGRCTLDLLPRQRSVPGSRRG